MDRILEANAAKPAQPEPINLGLPIGLSKVNPKIPLPVGTAVGTAGFEPATP